MIKNKLAIIAGKGDLVQYLINSSLEKNYDLTIISISNPNFKKDHRYKLFHLERISVNKLLNIFKKEKISHICMAGYVERPNSLLEYFNPMSILLLIRFRSILNRGDAALFKLINSYLEKKGFKIVGASEINPEITLTEGVYSRKKIPKKEISNINIASEKVRLLGHNDIGQAAVVSKGRVIALEAAEGTDEMLTRVIKLNSNQKNKYGIFFKSSQEQQDLRTDMPTIGVQTIRLIIEAKLAGLAITAGDVIVLDFDNIVELVNKNDLFFVVLKK